ncbi:zinc-finger of the MIZ type in nse subunit domain-containing protein [Sarocladium implicatum]|nr:zinc-finger of the MIZ type in nse subunit domain-containing protein [Sarocladium implicatum]
MPRRLVNRTAPSPHVRSTQSGTSAAINTSLPAYQPPSCKHDPTQRLNELAASRTSHASSAVLARHLTDASRNLGHSADDLQARLRERRAKLVQIRKKREEKGIAEQSGEEEKLEEHVEKLAGLVKSLTATSEEAMRKVVDLQAGREDEGQVLKELETEFTNRRRTTEEQEPSTEPPSDGPLAVYTALREKKQNDYTTLTPHQRYALNNEYATFKKLWHMGLVGEDGPPLPDASRWFDARGNPVMSSSGVDSSGQNGSLDSGPEDDDDEDIAVAREVVSLICPLTQSIMTEPYSNRRCKHTFEKDAIKHHLRVSGTAQCPQTGCSQVFAFKDFSEDFFPDRAMMRRIQRAGEAERNRGYDDSRMYDDEEEDENMISDTSGFPNAEEEDDDEDVGGRSRRASRVPKKERMSMA